MLKGRDRFKADSSDLPTAGIRKVETDDADQLAKSISGWSQHYEQLNAGHFQGSLAELYLGGAQVFLEHTNLLLRQICTVPAGYVWFGLPLANPRNVRINGVEVKPGRIALQRGGRDFELLTPDGLDFWGIVLKEEELFRAALHFEKADWLSTAIERPIIAVSELHKTIVQQYCHYVFGHAQGAALPLAVQQTLFDDTVTALFSLFFDPMADDKDRSSTRQRHRIVVRADEYTRANPDRLISIGELCTALSTSRRSLQASFQEILGISPHAYIRAASLNAVRRQLKDPASPYQSVQDAAAAYGFWHMSQFARDYRQMFGEHPSSTLRRR